jgi:hypothetical protein
MHAACAGRTGGQRLHPPQYSAFHPHMHRPAGIVLTCRDAAASFSAALNFCMDFLVFLHRLFSETN